MDSTLKPCEKEGFLLNTKTSRLIKIGSIQHKKIIADGIQSKPTTRISERLCIKKEANIALQTIAKENADELNESDNVEQDLRKLLYKKLVLFNKKPRRKKYVSSSDSQSSDSD